MRLTVRVVTSLRRRATRWRPAGAPAKVQPVDRQAVGRRGLAGRFRQGLGEAGVIEGALALAAPGVHADELAGLPGEVVAVPAAEAVLVPVRRDPSLEDLAAR